MTFAVAVPVGPDLAEADRLRSLTTSLQASLGSIGTLIVIDDADSPRDLTPYIAGSAQRIVILHPPPPSQHARRNDRMTASTVTYLQWLADAHVSYVIKLDTDALVIGDFRAALEHAFLSPNLGVCGACDRNFVGGRARDLSHWRRQLRLACSPIQVRIGGGRPRLVFALTGRRARQRRFLRGAVRSAREHGYQLGEHCLGGAYAVSGAAARALAEGGALEDPTITVGSGLGEDVVLGLLVRAAGFRLDSLVAPGEPFALRHQGLLAAPEELVKRGHTIVHSVKSPDPEVERHLRQEFARLRWLANSGGRSRP